MRACRGAALLDVWGCFRFFLIGHDQSRKPKTVNRQQKEVSISSSAPGSCLSVHTSRFSVLRVHRSKSFAAFSDITVFLLTLSATSQPRLNPIKINVDNRRQV